MKPLAIDETRPRQIVLTVNLVLKGRSNNNGVVSLTASADSTTVLDEVIWAGCKVFLFPTNANAASEVATTYVSSKADGSFVIAHANNTDERTFDWMIVGG